MVFAARRDDDRAGDADDVPDGDELGESTLTGKGDADGRRLHRRRVGAVRPSHLMFTGGVGALIDLPNFSVLVRGLDDWNYDRARLGAARRAPAAGRRRQAAGHAPVEQLRPAPWLDGFDADPNGQAAASACR